MNKIINEIFFFFNVNKYAIPIQSTTITTNVIYRINDKIILKNVIDSKYCIRTNRSIKECIILQIAIYITIRQFNNSVNIYL